MNRSNVSIIIPTYGRPAFLRASLASIADQTLAPYEVILVDDCSDPPVEVPDVDIDVKVLRHARNMGPGAARNTGLAHATGGLILFLDDDDLLTPCRLQIGVEGIGDARAHCAAVELLHPTGETEHYEKYFSGDMRLWFNQVPHPTIGQTLHRTEDVVQFDPALRVSEDTEWWIRMAHSAVFSWSSEIGLRKRRHPEPRPGVQDDSRYHSRRLILHRHKDNIDRAARARLRGNVATAAILAGYRFAALRWAVAALATHPSVPNAQRLSRSLLPD